MSENPPRKRKYIKHSIKSLRLDLEAAEAGKTWRLLPEGFRAQETAMLRLGALASRHLEEHGVTV